VSETLHAHLDGKTPVFEDTIIVRDQSGEKRWIRETGKVIARSPDGRPLRMTGIICDETESIRAQENLREANRKLNLLASVTRHDILKLTMALAGIHELLAGQLSEDHPQINEYFRILWESIVKIQEQTSFTRDYQHIGVENPRWQQVEQAFSAAADHARRSRLEVRFTADGLEV